MENFTVKYVEDIAIIKVDLITATLRDSQALWDTMDLESIFEKKKIVIDLSGCNFVDSTFIGMIVKVFRYLKENNATLKLVFPQITDLDSFRVIGITKILDCYHTVSNALESFSPDSSVQKIDFEDNGMPVNFLREK